MSNHVVIREVGVIYWKKRGRYPEPLLILPKPPVKPGHIGFYVRLDIPVSEKRFHDETGMINQSGRYGFWSQPDSSSELPLKWKYRLMAIARRYNCAIRYQLCRCSNQETLGPLLIDFENFPEEGIRHPWRFMKSIANNLSI